MEHDNEEYKHIVDFNSLNREVEQVESLIAYYEGLGKDVAHLLEKRELLIASLEVPKQALLAFKPSPTTLRRYKNLYEQLRMLFDGLGEQSHYGRLDRNNGLILENYIYSSIMRDVIGVFEYEFIGLTKSYYSYRHDSDFDPTPIRTLLAVLMDEVSNNNNPPNNYIELNEVRNQILARILDVAKDEYKANRIRENIFR